MPNWWATSDALRDLLVEQGRMRPPQRSFQLDEIEPGWLVYDNEREHVGRVVDLAGRYIVIQRRMWHMYLWTRLYIPESAIGEAHEGVVLLNIPRDWVGSMGWGHPPRRPPRARHG
jgi:hypothetical protein